MPRIELFPYRFRDPLTGKWKRTRYVAEPHLIERRFAEFEILRPSQTRRVVDSVDSDARYFSPHRNLGPRRRHLPVKDPPENEPPHPEKDPPDEDPPVEKPPANDPPVKEPPVEEPSELDGLERFLMFLRRS